MSEKDSTIFACFSQIVKQPVTRSMLMERYLEEFKEHKQQLGLTKARYLEERHIPGPMDEPDARIFCYSFMKKYHVNIVLNGSTLETRYDFTVYIEKQGPDNWVIVLPRKVGTKPSVETKYQLFNMKEQLMGVFVTHNDFIYKLTIVIDNTNDYYYIKNAKTHSLHLFCTSYGFILSIDPQNKTDVAFQIPCSGKTQFYLISNYSMEGAERDFQKYILNF